MSKQEALSVAVYYHRRILEESCALDELGKTGAFVQMARPMPVGSPLVIRFRVDDKGVGPALPCTVSHVEEISSREKTGRSGVMISFAELEEDRAQFLTALVEGTAPQEAGAEFPEEPDFVLPEPPIPGEAIQPATQAEPLNQTKTAQPAVQAETDSEAQGESQADLPEDRPLAEEKDIAAGEIGGTASPKKGDSEVFSHSEQPSVVVDSAIPEQMELRAVSGEIGFQESAPPPQEQPSVVVGELLTESEPQTDELETKNDDKNEGSESDSNDGQPNEEDDKPKKKKRRRGRRKKKTK